MITSRQIKFICQCRSTRALGWLVALAVSLAGCGSTAGGSRSPQSCKAGDLAARLAHVEVANTGQEAVVLTDTGTATCHLTGVPRITLVGQHRIYTPAQVNSGNSGAVTLRHGQTASFWLQELAPGGFEIANVRRIDITLKGLDGNPSLPLTPYLHTDQELMVSAITTGIVSKAPRSASPAAPCAAGGLAVRTHFLDASMPGDNSVEILTNTGPHPCSVGGVPTQRFLNSDHATPPDSGSQITLGHGANASFLIFTPECATPKQSRCHPSASAIVGGIYRLAPGFT